MRTTFVSSNLLTIFVLALSLLTAVSFAQSNDDVLIFIPDGTAPIASKAARYVDDFINLKTRVIPASEYVPGMEEQFGAYVVLEEVKNSGLVSVNATVRYRGYVSYIAGGGRFSNRIPLVVLRNQQAMAIAIDILKALDEVSWKELVELFEKPVGELDD